jgi:hypothetical protein
MDFLIWCTVSLNRLHLSPSKSLSIYYLRLLSHLTQQYTSTAAAIVPSRTVKNQHSAPLQLRNETSARLQLEESLKVFKSVNRRKFFLSNEKSKLLLLKLGWLLLSVVSLMKGFWALRRLLSRVAQWSHSSASPSSCKFVRTENSLEDEVPAGKVGIL